MYVYIYILKYSSSWLQHMQPIGILDSPKHPMLFSQSAPKVCIWCIYTVYIYMYIYLYIYIFNSLWCFFHIHIICRYTYHLYLHTRYYMHMYVNMICVCVSKIYIFIYLFTNMWFSSPWSSNPPQNTPWFLLSRRSPTAGGSENSHTKFGVFFQRPQKKKMLGAAWGFCVLVRNILWSNKAEGSPRSKYGWYLSGPAMLNHVGMAKHLLSAYNFYGLLLTRPFEKVLFQFFWSFQKALKPETLPWEKL